VYLTSLHAPNSLRPSPSVYTCCKTGGGNGLENLYLWWTMWATVGALVKEYPGQPQQKSGHYTLETG